MSDMNTTAVRATTYTSLSSVTVSQTGRYLCMFSCNVSTNNNNTNGNVNFNIRKNGTALYNFFATLTGSVYAYSTQTPTFQLVLDFDQGDVVGVYGQMPNSTWEFRNRSMTLLRIA